MKSLKQSQAQKPILCSRRTARQVLLDILERNPSQTPPDSSDGQDGKEIDHHSSIGSMRGLATGRPFASSPYSSINRGRMVDDGHEDTASDRSRDVSQSGLGASLSRPPSTPEVQFCADALQALDKANGQSSRADTALALSKDILLYSPTTVMTILNAADDLVDASDTKARSYFFQLLEASASHDHLTSDDRQRIFDIAATTVQAFEVYYQIKCMRALTKEGSDLNPLDSDFISFLRGLLHRQYPDATLARKKKKENQDRSKSLLMEERGLFSLLELIADTIKASAYAFTDAALEAIIEETIHIAEKTPSKLDMERAVEILRATVEHSRIPESQLRQCVEVMCAIASAITELKEATTGHLEQLLRSADQDAVIRILLETVALAPNERHAHTVGGALIVLCILVCNNGSDGMPTMAFSDLLSALDGVHFANRRTRRDCLRAMVNLLKEESLRDEILDSDWENMIKIVLTATGDENYIHDKTSEPLTVRAYKGGSSASDASTEESLADDITRSLESLGELFKPLWLQLTPEQRELVSLFYFKLRKILLPDNMRSLIYSLAEQGHLNPGHDDWQNHQLEILRLFIWDRDMDSATCCMVIHVLSEALDYAGNRRDHEHFHMMVLRLLNDLETQLDLHIANSLSSFAVRVWQMWQPTRMEEILARFWPLLNVPDMTSEGVIHSDDSEIRINQVSLPFVELFLCYLPEHSTQTIALFDFLTEIAKTRNLSPVVRLPALRLLIRLRCDSLDRMFVNEISDSLALASTLLRTEATIGPAGRYSLDRPPTSDELPPSRHSRASGKVGLRASSGYERSVRPLPTPPLWLYPGGPGLPCEPPMQASKNVSLHNKAESGLKLTEWLIVIIDILQQSGHWEVYSYVLVHLPSQLCHPCLFAGGAPHLKLLRNVIVSQLQNGTFQEPPPDTGVSKGDVALCLYYSLTALLGYSELFARAEQDDMIRAFIVGIGGWERTAKTCIQSLALCCHLLPEALTRALPAILQKMSQIITQSNLTIDIMEFLGGLARLPKLYSTFQEEEYRTVFAICVKYLEHTREQRQKLPTTTASEADYNSNRMSGMSSKSSSMTEAGPNVDVHRDLPQYVFALAYHVITIWFLSIKLPQRCDHVGWITKNLAWKDPQGNEYMEEQSQVTLDMMHRVTYSDLGESSPSHGFQPSEGVVSKKTWLVGLSIVTIETASATGRTQITKRQASGTTYASYQQHTSPLPAHHIALPDDHSIARHGSSSRSHVFPNHVFLQLTSTIAPMPTPLEPIGLPDDDMTRRALSSFDRNDTVDGYKVGAVYVGNGQTEEADILANTKGDRAFELFLEGLGTKVPLKGADFNTQGLDREMDLDGEYTYAWRDRVAEIVFHVPTLMPTSLENDSGCISKKRHVGNDFVNIIFNNSGIPYRFGTLASQFNCVNIVVAPTNKPVPPDEGSLADLEGQELTDEALGKSCYTIQTISHPLFPQISPAAIYKLMPLTNIATFARQLALQCSVFSNVWTNRAGGEVISSWRNRLREIHKLREKYANTGESVSKKWPGAKGKKEYAAGDTFKGRVEMGGLAEEEGILAGLDFSRWAGPNPPVT